MCASINCKLHAQNKGITYLNLSHNKIKDHGGRLLADLLDTATVITRLDLSDNNIHAEVLHPFEVREFCFGRGVAALGKHCS